MGTYEKRTFHFVRGGLDAYARAKIRMLKEEFMIRMSYEEELHMLRLETEADMDHYAHQLIADRL